MDIGFFEISVILIACVSVSGSDAGKPSAEKIIRELIDKVPVMPRPRGGRIPLRGSRMENWLPDDDAGAREVLLALDARGIGMTYRVNPDDEENLAGAVRMGRLQQELGLAVGVHASPALYGFFNGDRDTLHADACGNFFFDDSFGSRKMGCPFRLEHRKEVIRSRMRSVLENYRRRGIKPDFVYFDWEIDGPLEWNEAWKNSGRCVICRSRVPNLAGDFRAFQGAVREIRSRLQRECAAEPVKEYFPEALVGNYGVYPHNGIRYWYDYFEKLPEGAPFIADQLAKYRPWYHEFKKTGYNFANPVVYTWYYIPGWYPEFENDDYIWFYNMLLTASNAARHTPPEIPLIAWVHWHITAAPEGSGRVPGMSERAYRELLAHMFLRGIDSLMMWCRPEETVKEVMLMREIYDEVGEWPDFLERGRPVMFDVPDKPGTVVSALKNKNRLLARRTDFAGEAEHAEVTVEGRKVTVPRAEGRFAVIDLPD